jgi:NAD(P)-dependent dehydrogenase (short-subunit alcohol dehydrogenase family)
VGTNRGRGETLLAEADRLGAGDRCVFLPADLSSLTMTRRLAGLLRTRYPSIDALVLGAFRFQPERRQTAEGIERTWALYVLSRFLLAEELRVALERAPHPTVATARSGTCCTTRDSSTPVSPNRSGNRPARW